MSRMSRTPSDALPAPRWYGLYHTVLCTLVALLSVLLLGSLRDLQDLRAERLHLIQEVRAMSQSHLVNR